MAIAFNLPSEREASEENFSRLNRLLSELYEVLCHILVSRQTTVEPQDNRRDRPFSDSDIDRLNLPELPPRRLSANIPPPLTFDTEYDDDDVFTSPRDGNDPFSTTRSMEIFGTRSGPRTPAGVLLSPRRDRRFTFAVSSEKHWKDKGGGEEKVLQDADELDSSTAEELSSQESTQNHPSTSSVSSEPSIFSSIIPEKLTGSISGSICTAVLFMLGWKILSKR